MILTHHGINSLNQDLVPISSVNIGGRDYVCVKLGNQWWLAENLDYNFGGAGTAKYINNDPVNYGIDGKYKCGLLYDWSAMLYLDTNKDNLLPDGWQVPSFTQWEKLIEYLGSGGAKKIKAKDRSITSSWPANWNGSNKKKFSAIPSGNDYDNYTYLGTRAYYWTSTQYSSTHGRTVLLLNDNDELVPNWNSKNYCMSIRLVKEEPV